MEDILASIKRIIAEDHETAVASPARVDPEPVVSEAPRSGFANLHLVDTFRDSPQATAEILELTQAIENPAIDILAAETTVNEANAMENAPAEPVSPAMPSIAELRANIEAQQNEIAAAAVGAVQVDPPVAPSAATPRSTTILSDDTAQASRQSLAALSALLVKPEPGNDNTLEGLVREMLRPMLKAWLDENLPALVEKLVEREIGRITGRTL